MATGQGDRNGRDADGALPSVAIGRRSPTWFAVTSDPCTAFVYAGSDSRTSRRTSPKRVFLKLVQNAAEFNARRASRPGSTPSRGTSASTSSARRCTVKHPSLDEPLRGERAHPERPRGGPPSPRRAPSGRPPPRRCSPRSSKRSVALPEEQREVFLLREVANLPLQRTLPK